MGRIDIDSYVGVDPFGGRDSTGALQQAIVDGEREPATEYVIGPGTYLYRPLVVRGSNLSFRARGRTRFIFQPAATAPRGHGIQLMGGLTAAAPQHDVSFEGFEMDGTLGYTGSNDYNAPQTGWDNGNKAFLQASGAGAWYDRISLVGCQMHGWRGEIIYGGGNSAALGSIRIEHCELGDTNGDAISTSAAQVIRRNRIYRCANNGIENTYDRGSLEIVDNDISDCDIDGIGIMTINATEPYGPAYVERNRLTNCTRHGITALGTRNAWIRRNTLTDCGWDGPPLYGRPIYADVTNLWQGSTTRDLHVRDNDVICDRHSLGKALLTYGLTDGVLDIEQPRVWRTAYAIAHGLTVRAA